MPSLLDRQLNLEEAFLVRKTGTLELREELGREDLGEWWMKRSFRDWKDGEEEIWRAMDIDSTTRRLAPDICIHRERYYTNNEYIFAKGSEWQLTVVFNCINICVYLYNCGIGYLWLSSFPFAVPHNTSCAAPTSIILLAVFDCWKMQWESSVW